MYFHYTLRKGYCMSQLAVWSALNKKASENFGRFAKILYLCGVF